MLNLILIFLQLFDVKPLKEYNILLYTYTCSQLSQADNSLMCSSLYSENFHLLRTVLKCRNNIVSPLGN